MWPQGAGPVHARPPTTPCRPAVSLACQSLHCATPTVKLHRRPHGGDARNGQALRCSSLLCAALPCPHRRPRYARAVWPWCEALQRSRGWFRHCQLPCAFACAYCVCVVSTRCVCVCLLFIVDQQCRTKTILATTSPVPQPRHRGTSQLPRR